MKRKKVSVCIITWNEEKNIRDCLASVQWADEIIVVDSGSNDKTLEICQEYGAKIIYHPFSGFRDQKNFALDQAKNEWILAIDADERVTDELREELAILIEKDSKADGYFIPRWNYYGSKLIRHSGWHPDFVLRFWKRSKGRWGGKNIHEKVVVHGKTDYCKNPISHLTYQNISDYMKRIDLYSTLSAQEKCLSGKRFSYMRVLLKPPLRFLKSYLWKLGFLDGMEGLIIALSSGYLTFVEEIKIREGGSLLDQSKNF